MKKLFAALLLLMIGVCFCLPTALAAAPELPQTESYCVIDADTGMVLVQKNMDAKLNPASITKILTLGLACEKAGGRWDGITLEAGFDDIHSLDGTGSSHIALDIGEEAPLTDLLYATQMASANDGANLLATWIGGGSWEAGVQAMNDRAAALGLQNSHFANPHGISAADHYTSSYDMAQILRWALEQPGFEALFTRNEIYRMSPTNLQPKERFFSQQDNMRIGSSRRYIESIRGSKIGYTDLARYTYACLAEQNGVRLICVTMHSELKTDKYDDVRALLGYAFSAFGAYTEVPSLGVVGALPVRGGGEQLGTVTVTDPGIRLLLTEGVGTDGVSARLILPEEYLLGTAPELYAVYTVQGGGLQEDSQAIVPVPLPALEALLAESYAQTVSTPALGENLGVLLRRSFLALIIALVVGSLAGAILLLSRRRRRLRARSNKR